MQQNKRINQCDNYTPDLSLCAFSILCIIAIYIRIPGITLNSFIGDEALYSWYAKKITLDPYIIFSHQLNEFHPPLFSIILAMGNAFFDQGLITYRSVTLLVNIVGIILIYLLGIRLKNYFVGLFASLLLAFNYLYVFHATKITVDGPLTVSILMLILTLSYVDGKSSFLKHAAVGLVASISILLKSSGIIVLPLIFVHYLFLSNEKSLKNKIKKFFIPFTFLGCVIFSIALANKIHSNAFFPYFVPNQIVSLNFSALSFYFQNQHQLFVYIPLLPFFYYGLVVVLMSKLKYKNLLLNYFIILAIFLSFFYLRTYRFGLMFVPAMYLFTGLGMDHLLDRLFKKNFHKIAAQFMLLSACLFICVLFHQKSKTIMKRNSTVCIGYDEAAQWTKNHLTKTTTVISELPRVLRYYSDIDFKRFGGQIVKLPKSKNQFEKLIDQSEGPIILEVTLWNELQPDELPSFINFEKERQYLEQLQFDLVKTVYKNIYINETTRKTVPVIRLYLKMPIKKLSYTKK